MITLPIDAGEIIDYELDDLAHKYSFLLACLTKPLYIARKLYLIDINSLSIIGKPIDLNLSIDYVFFSSKGTITYVFPGSDYITYGRDILLDKFLDSSNFIETPYQKYIRKFMDSRINEHILIEDYKDEWRYKI